MSDDEAKEPEGTDNRDEAAAETAAAEASASEGSTAAKPSRRKRRSKPAAGNSAESESKSAASGETTAAAAVAAAKGDGGSTSADGADPGDAERRDLPKWNRARVKRKAPKGEEQDAFQTTVRKAGRSILQRPLAVIGIIVAIAAVGAGFYAWQQSGESTTAQATKTLATAVAYEARGEVAEDLETIVADRVRPLPFPVVKSEVELRSKVDQALTDLEEQAAGSDVNTVADLVRAARLARASDFEGAEKAYRGFIKTQPGHRLVFMAREGLVITLEAQERWDDALAEIETFIGEQGDFFRDQALWHKGRILEAAGRGEEALDVYKQYMDEYPLDGPSLAADSVRSRLEELDPGSVPAAPATPGMGGLGGLGGLGQ